MRTQRTVFAAAAGFGVALLLLIGLRELTPDLFLAASRSPVGGYAGPAIWLIVFGLAIGATAMAVRFHYLVAAIPSGLVFLVYLPMLLDSSIPTWYPDWLTEMALLGFGPAPFLVSGILAFAALSRIAEDRWLTNPGTQAKTHRSPDPVR
jgi:hypothetical protein